jgi:hypothetical protein
MYYNSLWRAVKVEAGQRRSRKEETSEAQEEEHPRNREQSWLSGWIDLEKDRCDGGWH